MAIFTLSVSPSTVSMTLIGNTGLFPSPLIQSAQTIDRGGAKWEAMLNFNNMTGDRRAAVMALIAQLRGQANRVRISVSDNPKRGAYGGTPTVFGGGQTGNSLLVTGASLSVTNWIRAGDYFSVVTGSAEHELKMCTADANSNGSGQVTISFEPPLRAIPNDGASVWIGDGVLPAPQGVFLFEDVGAGWTSQPHNQQSDLSSATLTFIEDVFATQ